MVRLGPVSDQLHPCCGAWPAHRDHCANRRQPVCTDGRWTVPGWDESTSDRVLAECVAAELDRVDPR